MNINLRVNAPGMVKIELYDMAGRVGATIYEGNMANGIHQFELTQDIPEGQYVVRAVSSTAAVSQPVIVLNR